MSIPNYIAIEGVIGAGKTTLARMLADKIGAELLLDDAMNNPFLVDFYKDRKRYAFSAQLFFLLTRYQQQQQSLLVRDLFAEKIVADYSFIRDHIFATVNLSKRELILYEKFLPLLKADIPKPDLTIYLQTSTPVLLERIKKRNFGFERTIDTEYLNELNEAFNYFFFHYDDSPLLVIKTDDIDFVASSADFESLIEEIKKPVSGKKYYVPAGHVIR
ncbi:MAG: deoxynucleoside kinase [Candidatus Zixiibacteriota bacterium]|nr:MAG: deoxynucleoside kinase [candidate division Zixibacteria bacterium]HDL04275.1 deoxynucleoside kinase [candidate division Zixibacteria bacterium]